MKTTENCFLNRLAWFAHDLYLSHNYNDVSVYSDEYKNADKEVTRLCSNSLRRYEQGLITEQECVWLLAGLAVKEVKGK